MSIAELKDKSSFEKEFEFKSSRSGGKGGQNVNKVETRIELIFDIANSSCLNEIQKERIKRKLKNKIGKDGFLRIVSQTGRSQYQNKIYSMEKFFDLIEKALREVKPRIKTKPRESSVHKRLESKKKTSIKKNLRNSGGMDLFD